MKALRHQLEPRHVSTPHADAGNGAQEKSAGKIMGIERKEQIAACRAESRYDKDALGADTIGKNAENYS